MLDQDENNFAWGEGGLECADLNVTHYRVFHSECLNFLQLLVGSPYNGWDTTLKKQSPAPPTSNILKQCCANRDCNNLMTPFGLFP